MSNPSDELNAIDEEEHIKAQLADPYEELFAFSGTSSVQRSIFDNRAKRMSSEFSYGIYETESPRR